MDEREGLRLRTGRLRGQLSQGSLLSTSLFPRLLALGDEVNEDLGIAEYEPPVPVNLAGEAVGPFPSGIAKTD